MAPPSRHLGHGGGSRVHRNFYISIGLLRMEPSSDPLIMEDDLRELRSIVDERANNANLWFCAEHVTERDT